MNLLTVDNVTKSFGEKLLFENISFGISSGQKLALIARNGTGKTSLLRILTGAEPPDSGLVTVGNDVRISYLPQNPEMDESHTIMQYLFATGNKMMALLQQYTMLSSGHNFDKETAQHITGQMDELHAWNYEARIKEILSKFDIVDLQQSIGQLSGGMRKKVALAKALIDDADLVILDEPTNHLDVTTIEWIENYLNRQNLALLLVTHDRYFLDQVCNEILEIDNQTLYKYRGNYTYFLEKREERLANEKTEILKARANYKMELDWMRRMPQARATKAKAREDNFYRIEEIAKTSLGEQTRGFDVDMQRLGGKILELNNIEKAYDTKKLLNDFSYIFKKGDRIGIIGANGVGKSTLLQIIMEEVKPDKGRVVKGKTLEIGYFRQEGLPMKEDKRIIDIVKDIAEQVEFKKGSMTPTQFLSYFNFKTDIHYNYYSSLSGGERRKLYLLTTLLRKPNFLILDEPTNDLDIDTLNKLEEFLMGYEGCLMIVSHDRYFMDHVVDHIFAFEGDGRIRDYYGNYSEYARLRRLHEKQQKSVPRNAAPRTETRSKSDLQKPTYKQVKEYEALTEKIDLLELERAAILDNLNSGNGTPDELIKWSEGIAEIMRRIDEASDRWLELSEIIEAAN
ncbi:MAG: ABC transporter ATP-binding protein [Clostridia bacterium]|nr:ABC transporter ATP-binding protein [Clostridia bacterium]